MAPFTTVLPDAESSQPAVPCIFSCALALTLVL